MIHLPNQDTGALKFLSLGQLENKIEGLFLCLSVKQKMGTWPGYLQTQALCKAVCGVNSQIKALALEFPIVRSIGKIADSFRYR
jgi:hypothetical protein